MQKSQFIRLKPASSQISELLIMKSYFEHLSNKNISLKITIEKILRILLRIYKIKKTKEIFPLSFYFLQRKTHPLESMAKCFFGKKISFSCCSRFLLSVLWKSVWLSAHPLFRGPQDISNPIGKAWIVREVTQVWNTAQFAQNHAVFCDLWLCEGFYSVWSILGCLNRFYGNFGLFGLLLLKLEWKPCDCPPFFVLFVARCNIGMLINLL